MKKITIMIGISTSLLIAACGKDDTSSERKKEENSVIHGNQETHAGHAKHSGPGDIREETSGLDKPPAFLSDKPDDMKTIYLAAAQNKGLLEQMPCYCGCGEEAGHKNNYDCFVFENKKNGAVVWDDHGTKCGVCLEIAAQSVVDYSKGKSVKEIRENIDKQYKDGYAKPTPTPEV
ncbi:PCYCGC domain-containing protein [Bacillus sp. V59.32b]|uniref:PCYCGC domain-containing protein n=1 Tax=Bacillus sp. V59.32b TaxID=1758642 RepID=UPI0020B17471|nr:PCYCGC domain-containing protein [Bacillus sp. V59.32b]